MGRPVSEPIRDLRRKALALYFGSDLNATQVAHHLGIKPREVQRWTRQRKQEMGYRLQNGRTRVPYPPEVKQRALELYESGLSSAKVSSQLREEFDRAPSPKSILNWLGGKVRSRAEAQRLAYTPDRFGPNDMFCDACGAPLGDSYSKVRLGAEVYRFCNEEELTLWVEDS